jgi:hypothetical protein
LHVLQAEFWASLASVRAYKVDAFYIPKTSKMVG